MARRKLTDEERYFKRIGTGIPFSRWWPAAAIFGGLLVAPFYPHFVATCTGLPLHEYRPRQATQIAMFLSYPCSPYLLREGNIGWLIFMGLWVPWPFAVANWRWATRQRRFWDGERLREAERRKARKAKRDAETFYSG
jgi:hypothetical protein